MKKILLSLLLVVFSFNLYGQNITGKIVDEENRPIGYANVIALTADSLFVSGVTSDVQGDFHLALPSQPSRAALLRVSFIGYEDKYLDCKEGDMGTVRLRPSSVRLEEVTVTVPQFKLSHEGLQTNVTGTLLSKAGTANDVLRQLPNVEGSDGDFTVFGRGTPLIFINGKEVRNAIELETLSSEDIANIKVITNPGAQYDNTVKAVIRIKTRKKQGEGLSGSVRSVYKQAYRSGFVEQLSLNYRKDKLDLFATLFYNNLHQKQTQTSVQDIYGKLKQNSSTQMLSHTQYLYGSAGFNYEFNGNHSIGATYRISREPGNTTATSDNTVLEEGHEPQEIDYDRDFDSPKGTDHQLNAYYNGTVGNLQIDYNFDYLYGKGLENQFTTQSAKDEEPVYITTNDRTHNKLLASKLILSYPLGNGQLDAGSEYTYTRRKEVFANAEQLLTDTDDRINESNASAFAKYSMQWGAWMLSAGVRYQFTRSDYYQKGIKIDEQSCTYNKWLPEASIGYGGEKFQAVLSYGAKTTRPSYYMLASNVQYDDQYTYEGGNPLLQPSVYHNLNLEMMYDWVYFSVGYMHKKDEILNVDRLYNENAVLFTFDNIDKVQEVNAMLSLSPRFGCWEPTYNASVNKQFLDQGLLGVSEKLGKPIFCLS